MAQPVANPDVWTEILRYFRISLTDDNHSDIKHKRRTILSIALTCSQLTDPGLDELWRSMTTLEPAVRTLNGGFQFVEYENYWVSRDMAWMWLQVGELHSVQHINVPLNELDSRTDRLHSYLRRVRHLRFNSFPSRREQALWLDLPIPEGVLCLCPNLKGLSLDLFESARNLVYNLSPLISPSLTEISLTAQGDESNGLTAFVFLSMLKRHGIQLLHMTYRGSTHPRIFRQITQFSSLSSLTMRNYPRNDSLMEEALISSSQNLSRLTRLELEPRMTNQEAETKFGQWLARLDNLSDLTLRMGRAPTLHSILGTLILASIRSLTLKFGWLDDATSAELFTCISFAFPKLQSLVIHCSRRDSRPPVAREHIMMLKGRAMERINLVIPSTALTPADIVHILISWPSLKNFCIQDTSEMQITLQIDCVFEAEDVLTRASMHGIHLRYLALPLWFSSLTTESFPMISSPNCPLQELVLRNMNGIPNSLEKKLILVQNLIALFPRLNILRGDKAGDLQLILNALQKAHHFPAHRPDHLYYYD